MNPSPQLHKDCCHSAVFEKLHRKYSKDLHNFIYYKYGEQNDPKDMVQTAFLKLWENCKSITPEKAKSFLFSVANNATLNVIKHKTVVFKHQKNASILTKDNQDPQFILEEKQYMDKYQMALSKLTPEKRVAFLMNRVEGKKHKEIAELLGISRKAVEKRIYTALEQLRKDIHEI